MAEMKFTLTPKGRKVLGRLHKVWANPSTPMSKSNLESLSILSSINNINGGTGITLNQIWDSTGSRSGIKGRSVQRKVESWLRTEVIRGESTGFPIARGKR